MGADFPSLIPKSSVARKKAWEAQRDAIYQEHKKLKGQHEHQKKHGVKDLLENLHWEVLEEIAARDGMAVTLTLALRSAPVRSGP